MNKTHLIKLCTGSFFAAGLKELDEAIERPFSIVINDL